MEDKPIQVKTIVVRTGRIVCDIEIPNPAFRTTSPKLAAFVTNQYPDLPLHACVNEVGTAFGSVIEKTSIPHMLEHLVVDIQAHETDTPRAETFVGTSEWTDEEAGKARVEASFRDDLQALRAFNKAVEFLNTAVLTCLS